MDVLRCSEGVIVSQAMKCDRCGSYFEVSHRLVHNGAHNCLNIHYRNGSGERSYGSYYDLCPDCMSDLESWLEMKSLIVRQLEDEPKTCDEMRTKMYDFLKKLMKGELND